MVFAFTAERCTKESGRKTDCEVTDCTRAEYTGDIGDCRNEFEREFRVHRMPVL